MKGKAKKLSDSLDAYPSLSPDKYILIIFTSDSGSAIFSCVAVFSNSETKMISYTYVSGQLLFPRKKFNNCNDWLLFDFSLISMQNTTCLDRA